jgi:hypothetical protein
LRALSQLVFARRTAYDTAALAVGIASIKQTAVSGEGDAALGTERRVGLAFSAAMAAEPVRPCLRRLRPPAGDGREVVEP